MLRFSSASLLWAAALAACGGPRLVDPNQSQLLVGAAAVDITPPVETFEDLNGNGRYDPGEPFVDLNGNGKWDPVYLAGFSLGRTALGVHDPLWVRGVVFERSGRRVLLLACDLIGLLQGRVRQLRARLGDVGDVILCSTHTHSGPDTVGLWGPFPAISGVSEEYLKKLEDAVLACARRALETRVPAVLLAGSATVEGVCKDIRPPDIRDEVAPALLARDRSGRAIAVIVGFAMHPEGMGSKNRQVSSDYPHYLRQALERDYPGATALFVSQDLGGMQTPDIKEHTWGEIERCGEAIAQGARRALEGARPIPVPEIKFARAEVEFPLENRRFLALFHAGTFGKDAAGLVRSSGGQVRLVSEVCAARLGEVVFVTVPGEALPEVGRQIFALVDARVKFLVGLGQDEIGYILPKEDFDPKKYEESMSLGPETAPTLLDALNQLLKGF
jgi:hypothetical protein